MAYQSLYRKYRPQNFADVMGQGHVTRTLQNALGSGRIAHGYLFTGTRGTAKTTIARLLAKALNCESSDRPVPEPCNRCAACRSITAGSSIDVVEMDAASHRGVADIEEVRKAVGYGPMELRYKVYIIDEAHQLSSDAKDAFLKTLEEPPDNVVFILATTEPQAIPITIRSRCQQFDFKRGLLADIAARLRYVLDSEGVTFTDEAVNLIGRGAEGSWRDALSLLEQVLAFSPKQVTAADVNAVLGTLDSEMLARVTDAIARRDAPSTFALAGEMLDAGKEARTLLRTLAAHFRDLMLVSVGGPAVAAELTPDEVSRLQQQARAFTIEQMRLAIDVLNQAQGETRWNNQHRLLVELAFLKLMTLGDAPSAPLAVAPIVFATAPAKPVGPSPAPPLPAVESEPVPTIDERPAVETPALRASDSARTSAVEELPPAFFAEDSDADSDEAIDEEEQEDLFDEAPGEDAATPATETLPEDLGPSLFDEPEFEPARADTASAVDVKASEAAPEPEVASPPIVESAEPQETPRMDPEAEEISLPAAEPAEFSLDDVFRAWPRFLSDAQRISRKTEMMMLQTRPAGIEGHSIVIQFQNRAAYDMMSEPAKREFVRKLLARSLGTEKVAVRFALADDAPPPPRVETKKKQKRDPLAALDTLDVVPSTEVREAPPTGWAASGFSEESRPREPLRRTPGAAKVEITPAWPVAEPSGGDEPTAAVGKQSPIIEAALEHPLVQEALSIFGGEVVVE
jgi:DNA polymerase-3 subunit gamma/tau